MKEDHANMPGMGDQGKKPEQGKAAAIPQKEQASKKPDAPAQADKTKPKGTPGKS